MSSTARKLQRIEFDRADIVRDARSVNQANLLEQKLHLLENLLLTRERTKQIRSRLM